MSAVFYAGLDHRDADATKITQSSTSVALFSEAVRPSIPTSQLKLLSRTSPLYLRRFVEVGSANSVVILTVFALSTFPTNLHNKAAAQAAAFCS